MKILNLVDHLCHGGVQRMALNIANMLAERGHDSALATVVRHEGDLEDLISDRVAYTRLEGKSVYSTSAARRLHSLLRREQFDLVHVHHRSLYTAFQSLVIRKKTAVIWHDHYGRQEYRERPFWVYYPLTRVVDGVIAVSHPLMTWAVSKMHFPPDKVRFIPNFVDLNAAEGQRPAEDLPGEAGFRVVCVANFRPHKDHGNLLHAFRRVVNGCPRAHLLLVGGVENEAYFQTVRQTLAELDLAAHVTILGPRMDIAAILAGADIGVLSSRSEGLPLALIEYGVTGLPVVCTKVGDTNWLIRDGANGFLVDPAAPEALGRGILSLLEDRDRAKTLASRLQGFVQEHFHREKIIEDILAFYQDIMPQNPS